MISVIITSFDEGDEVRATIDSIKANTSDCEVILVDDGSTDGSCENAGADQLITHKERIGIAQSRLDGVAVAQGDAYSFLDAHQRVSEGCLNKCAELAIQRDAIVWPDCTGLGNSRWVGHGASMRQKSGKKKGLFDGRWKGAKPMDEISRCSTMIVPGYTVPKSVWQKVKLPDGLKYHGASEPALTVKAFFTDVSILHLCGPLARHMFRDGHRLPFKCPWRVTARNHAIVARVCFDNKTWETYWGPNVFKRHLREDLPQMDEDWIMDQQKEFQKIKQRPDDEFWRGLMLEPTPY